MAEVCGGYRAANLILIEDTIAGACSVIREHGFTSKKSEYEGDGVSTASLLEAKQSGLALKIEDCDKAKAAQVIEWIDSIDPSTVESEYLEKLFYLVDARSCDRKNLGIVVSSVSAFDRHVLNLEREANKGKSVFVGAIKKRENFKLTCVTSIALPDYGFGPSFVNVFRDGEGNCLTWKTSFAFDKEEVVTLKGTVKEHKEFRGEKQTVLTRCKVIE